MSPLQHHAPVILHIFGGLALFLFSMQLLSTSLQNVVGGKIESALKHLTNRPYKGMLVGTFVTFLTQSSSITVLTLIGLVNVGALNLERSIGILLGAEIGTTITAQLIAFKIGNLFYPLLLLGFIITNFAKDNHKTLGKVIFSFGLLFMGMEIIKSGAKPISSSPQSLALFESLGTNPLLGIITGAIFTGITSSSSATTSLVVALGATNSITLPAAIAIMLGANIGTTLLELIAIIHMSLTAKRIAIAQALINVLGVVIILPFLTPFSQLTALTSSHLGRQIANSHTIFNLASSLIFLGFTKPLVSLTKKLTPGKITKLERGTKFLDPHILHLPHVAISHAAKETHRMGQITLSLFSDIKQLLPGDQTKSDIIVTKEAHIDTLYRAISQYLNQISTAELNPDSTQLLAQLSHVVTDLERASDHLHRVSQLIDSNHHHFPPPVTRSLLTLLTKSSQAFQSSLQAFSTHHTDKAQQLPHQFDQLNQYKKRILTRHASDLDTPSFLLYSRLAQHIERAGHHGENISHVTIHGF